SGGGGPCRAVPSGLPNPRGPIVSSARPNPRAAQGGPHAPHSRLSRRRLGPAARRKPRVRRPRAQRAPGTSSASRGGAEALQGGVRAAPAGAEGERVRHERARAEGEGPARPGQRGDQGGGRGRQSPLTAGARGALVPEVGIEPTSLAAADFK